MLGVAAPVILWLRVHDPSMIAVDVTGLVAQSGGAAAPLVQPGAWNVTSKVVELTVPGVPGFLVRMARGKSKAERKQIAAGQGIKDLLVPDPKAKSRIESQSIAEGRYAQVVACPQKDGEPMRITRTGSYDASGFTGQAIVNGTTSKGTPRIILDQQASRAGI